MTQEPSAPAESSERRRPKVVLMGPPGAGKSTVARKIATLTGWTVLDTDLVIEERAGKPIGEIFVDDGEPAFRDLEREVVAEAIATHDGILALGGGSVMDPRTEADLSDCFVVFLDVSLAHAAPRVGFNAARPLLLGNPRAQWQQLMAGRRPTFERIATVTVSTDGRTAAAVARDIVGRLGVTLPPAPDPS